jgi:hypothetical protein
LANKLTEIGHRSLEAAVSVLHHPRASLTRCHRCNDVPVLATVIDGLERRLDPLPLSMDGLAEAVATGRWVG